MSEPTDRSTEWTERFEQAFRAWASRPPATPADRAARRVADQLPERQPRHRGSPGLRLLVAAALVAAVGLALILDVALEPDRIDTPTPHGTPAVGGPIATATTPPAPTGDVLVIDLDPRTTLYLNLNGPAPDEGSTR